MLADELQRPSLVAHIVVVGFHAQLGNRIEFAYPRLRGDTVLRSPRLSDTSDICDLSPGSPRARDDAPSPTVPGTATPPFALAPRSPSVSAFERLSRGAPGAGIASARTPERAEPAPADAADASTPPRTRARAASGDWGALPDAWAHLPFMAIPDGAHALSDDVVYFCLPPDVHCVSCFRQACAGGAVTHSASRSSRAEETSVAARGSVQKSIVLLCRRPLFGFLAHRLVPAVRAYFDQGDFARTDALAGLYHSLNMSLAHPSLRLRSTLFHGIGLQGVLRVLGPQTLAVLKLLLLEKRVVFYSHPVQRASATVVAIASLLPGALDSVARAMPSLDTSAENRMYGLPLALFGPKDRVAFQPYAPLPVLSQMLHARAHGYGCVVGTSHNCGVLLASTAAKASKAAAPHPHSQPPADPRPQQPRRRPKSTAASVSSPAIAPPPRRGVASVRGPATSDGALPHTNGGGGGGGGAPPRANGRLPVVDALVNLTSGKVSVAGAIEPLCRITRDERRLMRDLMVAAAGSGSLGSRANPEDYIRGRVREYLLCFLSTVASVPRVLGGPLGGEAWSAEMASHLRLGAAAPYNAAFARAWLQTRNGAVWSRRCGAHVAAVRPVPAPELDDSLMDEPLLPVDRVAAGLTEIRDNVAFVSSKAAEGLSSLLARFDLQPAPPPPPRPAAPPDDPPQKLDASRPAPAVAAVPARQPARKGPDER